MHHPSTRNNDSHQLVSSTLSCCTCKLHHQLYHKNELRRPLLGSSSVFSFCFSSIGCKKNCWKKHRMYAVWALGFNAVHNGAVDPRYGTACGTILCTEIPGGPLVSPSPSVRLLKSSRANFNATRALQNTPVKKKTITVVVRCIHHSSFCLIGRGLEVR